MNAATAAAAGQLVPENFVDVFVLQLQEQIRVHGYEEVLLPPSTTEFSEMFLGVTWKGKLILSSGKFRGLQRIQRVGNVQLSFNESANNQTQLAEMTFTVTLGLTNCSTTHDFQLIFMNRDMNGVVDGTVSNVTFDLVLGLNLLTHRMRLIRFKFQEIGNIETVVTGLGSVMDFIGSKFAKVVANRIKWDVATEVEADMQTFLSEMINETMWPKSQTPNVVVKDVRKSGGSSKSN